MEKVKFARFEENGDDMIHTAASRSEISALLNALKSIDKIVIVDDVRKYGPEEIKKLHEEIDTCVRTDEDKEGEIEL